MEQVPPVTGWVLLEFCLAMLVMIIFSPQAQMRALFSCYPWSCSPPGCF